MNYVKYINRIHTNCSKWDTLDDKALNEGLLPMWIADMDFAVPDCVTDALHHYLSQGAFGYYIPPDSYYDSFLRWEKEQHSLEVKKEWLRFSPGVVAAFHWFVQILTEPGESVIVLTPVYYPFFHAVENNGRTLITSDLVNTNGVYTIDFDDFEKKIAANNVKAFLLCSPHNPVGRVWTQTELVTLFEICKKYGVYIISDEIHQDLTFDGHKNLPSLLFDDYKNLTVATTAPSKTFNLAACQNSFSIIPNEEIRQKWDSYTLSIRVNNGNAFGYVAAEAAYTYGLPWYHEVKDIIYDNYLYLKERLAQELPDLIISPLEGTYLTWLDLHAYTDATNIKELIENKCLIYPDYGEWFGGERFSCFIRLNLATSKENIIRCAECLILGCKNNSIKKS